MNPLRQPLSILAIAVSAAMPLAVTTSAQAQSISSFKVQQVSSLTPGSELGFTVNATPGSTVTLQMAGATAELPLVEVRRGVYEGSYTVRTRDRITAASAVTARVVYNGRTVTLPLDHSLVIGAAAPARSGYYRTGQRYERATLACANCGRIESVDKVVVKDSSSHNVLGTVAGGVVGGVIGNQVGGGRGKDVARIAGAIGGAYVGNRIQNNRNQSEVYRVAVRMSNGTVQSFDYADDPAVAVGARVRVEDGVLVRS